MKNLLFLNIVLCSAYVFGVHDQRSPKAVTFAVDSETSNRNLIDWNKLSVIEKGDIAEIVNREIPDHKTFKSIEEMQETQQKILNLIQAKYACDLDGIMYSAYSAYVQKLIEKKLFPY